MKKSSSPKKKSKTVVQTTKLTDFENTASSSFLDKKVRDKSPEKSPKSQKSKSTKKEETGTSKAKSATTTAAGTSATVSKSPSPNSAES